jgi:hypothetical protein
VKAPLFAVLEPFSWNEDSSSKGQARDKANLWDLRVVDAALLIDGLLRDVGTMVQSLP